MNDLVVGPPAPVPDCEDRLRAAGVTFKPARIGLKKKDGVGICLCLRGEIRSNVGLSYRVTLVCDPAAVRQRGADVEDVADLPAV